MNGVKKNWCKDLQTSLKLIGHARLQTRKVLTEADDYDALNDELQHAQEHIFFVLEKTSEVGDDKK